VSDDREKYGRIAYEAYGDSVNWTAVSGTPMPTWDETLPRIREAWCAAAERVTVAVLAAQAGAPVTVHVNLGDKEIHKALLRAVQRYKRRTGDEGLT